MSEKAISKATQSRALSGAPKTMKQYVESMQGEIAKALPSVITPERFTRIVLSALSATPQLQECSPQSFLGAMMTAAQLGVEVNSGLGQAYVLPYRNHGQMEAQFQLSYKGYIDLAYRSGEIEVIQSHVVYEGDEFNIEYGLEPKLTHKPALHNRGAMIGVYAMFKTKAGGYGFEWMSEEDIRKHAEKYSKAYKSGFSPWQTSFEEMAKKTVLKRVLKMAPLKSDFVKGIAQDETIKTVVSEHMDEELDVTNYAEVEVGDETVPVDTETGEIK